MDITSTTLILIGVICVVLGFFASVLLNTLREDEVQGYVDDTPAPPGGKKERYVPVVRLWREKKTGAIIVEKDGKSFVTAVPLTDAQHSELEQTERDFRAWLGMGLSANLETPGQFRSQISAPDQSTQLPATTVQGASGMASTAAPSSPSPTRGAKSVGKKGEPADSTHPAPAGTAAPLVGAKSIVMQIEDILQDMLVGNPLEIRGIHLTEDPGRGVMVSIGGQNYEGIDVVPDPEIRAIIRAAVSQWENSQ